MYLFGIQRRNLKKEAQLVPERVQHFYHYDALSRGAGLAPEPIAPPTAPGRVYLPHHGECKSIAPFIIASDETLADGASAPGTNLDAEARKAGVGRSQQLVEAAQRKWEESDLKAKFLEEKTLEEFKRDIEGATVKARLLERDRSLLEPQNIDTKPPEEAIAQLLDNLSHQLQRYNGKIHMHDPTTGFEPLPPRNYLPSSQKDGELSSMVDTAENILARRIVKADERIERPKPAVARAGRHALDAHLDQTIRYADWTSLSRRPKRRASTADLAFPGLPCSGTANLFNNKRRKVDFDKLPKEVKKRVKKIPILKVNSLEPEPTPLRAKSPKTATAASKAASTPHVPASLPSLVAPDIRLSSDNYQFAVSAPSSPLDQPLPTTARSTEAISQGSRKIRLFGNAKIGMPHFSIFHRTDKVTVDNNPFVQAMVERASQKENITKAPKVLREAPVVVPAPVSAPAPNARLLSLSDMGSQAVEIVLQKKQKAQQLSTKPSERSIPEVSPSEEKPEATTAVKRSQNLSGASQLNVSTKAKSTDLSHAQTRAPPPSPTPLSAISDKTAVSPKASFEFSVQNEEKPTGRVTTPLLTVREVSPTTVVAPSQKTNAAANAVPVPSKGPPKPLNPQEDPAANISSYLPSTHRRRSRTSSGAGNHSEPSIKPSTSETRLALQAQALSLTRPSKTIFGKRSLAERTLDEEEDVPDTAELSGYLPGSLGRRKEGASSQQLKTSNHGKSTGLLAETEPPAPTTFSGSIYHGVRVDQPVGDESETGRGFLDLLRKGNKNATSSRFSLTPEDKKTTKSRILGKLFGGSRSASLNSLQSSYSEESKVFPSLASGFTSMARQNSQTKTVPSNEGIPDVLDPSGVACSIGGQSCRIRINPEKSTLAFAGAAPVLDKKTEIFKQLPFPTRRVIRAVVAHRTIAKLYAQISVSSTEFEIQKLKFDLGSAERAANFVASVNSHLYKDQSSTPRQVWVLASKERAQNGTTADKIAEQQIVPTLDCAGISCKIVTSFDKLPSDLIANPMDVLVCMVDEESMLNVLRRFAGAEPDAVICDRMLDEGSGFDLALKVCKDRPKCRTWILDFDWKSSLGVDRL